jgi:general stress protein YciG
MQAHEKQKRGFAMLSKELQREYAGRGGRAAHEKRTAHEWSPEEAQAAGRKGGMTTSANIEHMKEIGRLGGLMKAANLYWRGRRKKTDKLADDAITKASKSMERHLHDMFIENDRKILEKIFNDGARQQDTDAEDDENRE